MDAHRFDQLTRIVTHAASRRGLLGSGVASLAGLIALSGLGTGSIAARARKKKHRGKGNGPQPNAFGCVSVGKSCRGKAASAVPASARARNRSAANGTGQVRRARCIGLLEGAVHQAVYTRSYRHQVHDQRRREGPLHHNHR